MKYGRILFLLISFLTFANFSYSQNIPKIKGVAIKAARVNVYEQSLNNEEQNVSPVFKVPNQEWEKPEWDVGDKIIYRTKKKATLNVPDRVKIVSPPPDTTFLGLKDNYFVIPPDVMGVAGPDHIFTTLNSQVRVHSKDGTPLMTTSLELFWRPMPDYNDTFDPKIVYDPYTQRWIFVTPSHPDNALSKIFIGVSETSDPLGDWNMYYITADPTDVTWFDFPTIGFNKKWIVVCGNMYGGDYYRTVFAINKKAAVDGDEQLPYTRFVTTDAFTIVPAVTYDTALEQIYMIASADGNSEDGYGYIKKFKLTGDVDNPELIYEGAIGVPDTWGNSGGDYSNFLPQAGSEALINSVDSRIVNVIYRNGKLWAVHHIYLPADNPQRTAVQWWVLDTTSAILERGRIDDPSNNFYFAFPAIAVNKYEDIMIGLGVFSESQFASAGYAFKNHTDDSGTIRTYYQYKDGLAPYYKTYGGNKNRWGDYTATCVDPVDQTDFWVLQEYAEQPSNTWSTWWAYVKTIFKPEADFMTENQIVPTGESIEFNDLSQGIPSEWLWHFEGGNPEYSTDQNPSGIQYNNDGVYDVTLIVSNISGSDTITKEDYVTVSSTVLPEVNFGVSRDAVCTGVPVFFTDSTTIMPISWEWQFIPSTVTFEEGTNQYSQNPVVSFDEPGSYSVTLTASNINGQSSITKFDVVNAGGFIPYFHENFEEGFEKQYWIIDDLDPGDDRTWEFAEDVGYNSQHSAFIRFTNYIYWGHRDRLITPAFNLKGISNATLSFKYAYAKRYDDASDSLIIFLSEDCGNTWTRVEAYGDDGYGSFATSPQYDETDNWAPQSLSDWCGQGYGSDCKSISLNNWIGKNDIRIAFESFNFFGNSLYIDNVTVEQYTGVDETVDEDFDKEGGMKVFPNPAHNGFTVELSETDNFNVLEVFNSTGKVVFTKKVSKENKSYSINTENWVKGVYLIKAGADGQYEVKKLVVY
jgi:PKD repeat protein